MSRRYVNQYSDYDSDSSASRRQLKLQMYHLEKGRSLMPDSQGNTKRHKRRNTTQHSNYRPKIVMNETIKPQQTSFALRNSELEVFSQNAPQNTKQSQNQFQPKSSAECDAFLPIPETELSGEETLVAFGRETDYFTYQNSSAISIVERSGLGTERPLQQIKSSNVAPTSSRFHEEDILTQRSGFEQAVQNYHIM